MEISNNTLFGTAFILLALFLTFLMFYLWKFPFDHDKHQSSAPRSLMNTHRLFGYVYVGIYIYLMWDMVPRLWSYQIELPPRTVAHLSIGLAIGAILLIKIIVVRYFKHMEARLAPMLGTSLLICTLLLTGLALPYSAREAYLRITAQDGQNFSQERIERVKKYLPQIGFEDEAGLTELASSRGLLDGRLVLTKKCTQCHDLRTILAKPRTPDNWHKTVKRMANRSTILTPINESEQWQATAYLIAISPTLREVASDRRALKMESSSSKQAADQMGESMKQPLVNYNETEAKTLFEGKCSQCHSSALVDNTSLKSSQDVVDLVTRMVRNGLVIDDNDLTMIVTYLSQRFEVSSVMDAPQSQPKTEPTETNSTRY